MTFFSSRFTTIKDFLATQHWPTGGQLKNLLSWDYYTRVRTTSDSPLILLTTVITVLVLVGIFLWYWRARQLHQKTPVYDRLLDQLPTMLVFVVIFSVFYAFFWVQSIQYLSSPLVLLVAFLLLLGWIVYLAIYCWRVLPAKKQAHLEKERFFRYLPKSKKK